MASLNQEIQMYERRVKYLAHINTFLVVVLIVTSIVGNNLFPAYLGPMLVISYFLRVAYKRKLKYKRAVSEEVERHTVEIKTARDAAEAKSQQLKQELTVLEETKDEQVRQEKIETVGELTKGLVDRMLNPLNYISNFGLLSGKMVDDLEENLNELKSGASPDLWDDNRELVETLRNNLRKIVEHGNSATKIVKAMEELLRDRRGTVETVEVNRFIGRVVDGYDRKQNTDGSVPVGFRLQLLAHETEVEINPLQLEQSLLCILENACYSVRKKSLRSGEGGYRPAVEVALSRTDDQLLIEITDNGVGIEEAIREKIFAPFFTTKPTHEGAGVGLYMAREVVENHKGAITVHSQPGEFARFTVTLPV